MLNALKKPPRRKPSEALIGTNSLDQKIGQAFLLGFFMTLGEDTVPAFNLKLHLMRSGGTDVIARGNACFKLKRLFVNVFFNEVAKALQFFKRQLSQVTAAAACKLHNRAHDIVRFTEGQTLLREVVGKVGGRGIAGLSGFLHFFTIGGDARHHFNESAKRVLDRVEYRGQSVDIPNWTILSTVIDAFASGSCLVIRYTSLRDEVSERTIEPGRLICYNNTWYVVAYDYKRDDIRTFHLSRIQEARVTGKRMVHDVSGLKDGYGIFLSDHLEEYRIRFTGAAARIVSTQVWSDDQRQERQADGSLILALKSSSLEELVPAVLSFGSEAQPLSPQSFVDEYRRRLRALFERECLTAGTD